MVDSFKENKHYSTLEHFSRKTNHLLSLNLFYININRLKNKLNGLEHLLHSQQQQIDVVILTETFLYDLETKFYNLPQYNSFHNTRNDRDGGGISVFVHSTIEFQLLHKETTLENEFVIIYSKQLNLSLICVYKPPHTYTNDFLSILDKIISRYKNSIVVGDFNLNLLNESDPIVSNYNSILQMNGLNVINKLSKTFATRIQGNSSTIIDHILSSFDNGFHIFYGDTCLSDHKYFFIKFVLSKKSTYFTYDKITIDNDKIIEFILDNQNLYIDDFEAFYDTLRHSIATYSKKTIVTIKTCSYRKPWFNNELKKLANYRDKFYKLHKKYPNNNFFLSSLKEAKGVFQSRIVYYKKLYYTRQFEQNLSQPKILWRIINQILRNSASPKADSVELKIKDILTCDPVIVANRFVEFFSNIGTEITKDYPPNFRYREPILVTPTTLQSLSYTNEEEIGNIITNLDLNTSAGHDQISATHVKKLKNIITPLLTKVINKWIDKKRVPASMKIARITPIFKGGDKCLVENYRPISVLPIFSKIFERVILSRIVDHLDTHKIIHKHQYGFCKAKSTVSATLNLFQNVYGYLEGHKTTACMFLDLIKAFDCVDHNILLRKIALYGFSVNIVSLIESYLTNRVQFIKISNFNSEKVSIKCGVPQGSILGPVLFLIYINDIFTLNLYGKIQLFADDIAITYGCNNSTELKFQMESDLQEITGCLYNSKLKLNSSKSCFIIFYLQRMPLTIFDEVWGPNSPIKRTQNTVFLGLKLNTQLSWTDHINNIKRKVSPYIGALRRTARYIPQDLCYNLYFGYIHAHLIYLTQIWGSASNYLIDDLQVLQNKSLKAIRNLPALTPTKQLYNEKILPISKLIEFEYMVTIYKIKFGIMKCVAVDLTTNFEITEITTRNCKNYRLPNYKLSLTQNSIFYRGVELFNKLNESDKHLSISRFKSTVKKQLYHKFTEEYDLFHN